MDLRILKTKKAIRQAFFTIRAKTPLEKVKVVELCNEAMINKTTFYKYYEDVFCLSAELENEFFESFWANFEAKDLLLTDTAQLITRSGNTPLSMSSPGRWMNRKRRYGPCTTTGVTAFLPSWNGS